MPIRYWLMKSEPSVYSIDNLARDKATYWDGVRNFQARNFMRDEMEPGDRALFYHSNAEPSGIAGIMEITKTGYSDPSAFDPKDIHYDPKSKKEKPTWFVVDVKFAEKFRELISLDQLKQIPVLKDMVLFKSPRLSVQPVREKEWKAVLDLEKRLWKTQVPQAGHVRGMRSKRKGNSARSIHCRRMGPLNKIIHKRFFIRLRRRPRPWPGMNALSSAPARCSPPDFCVGRTSPKPEGRRRVSKVPRAYPGGSIINDPAPFGFKFPR